MRELLARPLLVVTGKGGVGKSTVAAALGLAAARRGLRAVSRALAGSGAPSTFVERSVADGLSHISIDPESALEEYLRDQLPRGVAEVIGGSRTFSYLAAATPGLRELLTIGKVWELAQPDRRTPGAAPYDVVVLDAPATGHGVAILGAPRTFAEAARVGPVARQGRTIHEMLSDPARTGIVAVTTPEEMPVNEALELPARLEEAVGRGLSAVVVNGMLPRRFTGPEVERLQAAGPSTPVHAALADAARARSQRGECE
ncbi:MAG: chromosome partitioning protein, partial [Solirubrobacterales bacterium]|nr:chromosome partitioning protein [Solirubrobacterales bacterium]